MMTGDINCKMEGWGYVGDILVVVIIMLYLSILVPVPYFGLQMDFELNYNTNFWGSL